MAKNNGKEGSPVDVYILSIGKEDSWKGTPLDVEEEQLKTEPTTTDSSTDLNAGVSQASPEVSKETEELANKIENTHGNNKLNSLNKSPFPRVCPPTQKEREAFRKSAPLPPPAAPSSGEALGAQQSSTGDDSLPLIPVPSSDIEKEEPRETVVRSPPPSSPPLPPPAVQERDGSGGGNGARKELEDAIQRIEAHIKTEQAARRAAEGALAQARQQSQDPSPATQLLSSSVSASTPLKSTPSYAELQIALDDLANAQLAVQRAHAVVAYILSQQQHEQQPQDPTSNRGNFQSYLAVNDKKSSTIQSPVIRHTAPSSPLGAPPLLPSNDGTSSGSGDVASSSPMLTKILKKERGMSWVAGGPKESMITKQNWTTPNLKVKTAGPINNSLDGSDKGEKSPKGALRKKDSNVLPSSPKTNTPWSSKKGDSAPFSPSRSNGSGSGGGRGGGNSPKITPEWNNDRFATGKAEAFMISQSARWNSK